MPLQLALFAVLAVVCVVGFRVESSRVKALEAHPDKRLPKGARKLFISGPEPWVVLGTSEEQSFETITADPEVESAGFEARDEDGTVLAVPSGTRVKVRSIEGARRAPLDAITKGGSVRPRFTMEVKPGTVVYTLAAAPENQGSSGAYRGGAVPLVGSGSEALVLSGDPANLGAAGAFPGCWMMILVPFVLGGAAASLWASTTLAWIAIAIATALVLFGWGALPKAIESPKPEG